MTSEDKKLYIPLDKSWIIRMGFLDIVNGYGDIIDFLENEKNLGDDLLALDRVAKSWNNNELIDVGESGTVYRLFQFASWWLELNKDFVKHGTLKTRDITSDPDIIHLSQKELSMLDNGTSQWASARALLGDRERLAEPPFKLSLTYEAIDHWQDKRKNGEVWQPRYDDTIAKQTQAFLEILKNGKSDFVPQQAEDYCFAYVFDFISAAEGEKRWPSLRGHESDRIAEMTTMLERAKKGEKITSKDHRVVQALAMWGAINNQQIDFAYPECVNKSWPRFWEFMSVVDKVFPDIT